MAFIFRETALVPLYDVSLMMGSAELESSRFNYDAVVAFYVTFRRLITKLEETLSARGFYSLAFLKPCAV